MSKKVLAAIEAAGGEFEEFGGRLELRGFAVLPAGLVWNATDCHTIAVSFFSDRPAGWRALMEDVAQGVREHRDPDCEICQGL